MATQSERQSAPRSPSEITYLFDSRFEFINIALGIFFLACCVVEICVNKFPFTANQSMFFMKVILFDASHVGMTFALLMFVPEMQDWRREREGGAGRLFLQCAAVGVAVMLIYLSQTIQGGSPLSWLRSMNWFFIGIISLVISLHGMYQFRGLSVLYNRKIIKKNGIEPGPEFVRDEKLERRAFRIMSLIFVALFWTVLRQRGSLRGTTGGFSWGSVEALVSTLFSISVLGFIFYSARVSRRLKSTKPLYLSRFLMFPMLPFSHFAIIGLTACHGVEYAFVSFDILKNSSISTSALRMAYLFFGVFTLALIILSAPMWLGDSRNEGPALFVMTTAYTMISFIHSYLDQALFRMRNPKSRELIGPLLSRV